MAATSFPTVPNPTSPKHFLSSTVSRAGLHARVRAVGAGRRDDFGRVFDMHLDVFLDREDTSRKTQHHRQGVLGDRHGPFVRGVEDQNSSLIDIGQRGLIRLPPRHPITAEFGRLFHDARRQELPFPEQKPIIGPDFLEEFLFALDQSALIMDIVVLETGEGRFGCVESD